MTSALEALVLYPVSETFYWSLPYFHLLTSSHIRIWAMFVLLPIRWHTHIYTYKVFWYCRCICCKTCFKKLNWRTLIRVVVGRLQVYWNKLMFAPLQPFSHEVCLNTHLPLWEYLVEWNNRAKPPVLGGCRITQTCTQAADSVPPFQ